MDVFFNKILDKLARLFHGDHFPRKKDADGRHGCHSLHDACKIDPTLTNRKWCLLETSVVPSFCTQSDHHLLRANIGFSRKLGDNSYHRPRRSRQIIYDRNVLNKILPTRDWQSRDDPTEDYDLLFKGLKSCADLVAAT
ncbi:hypothetical protein KIN20_015954 [Parelaphostrongylus tenuis]|uniref:Uncharacterized protein n=1 Tax=Parelaphostrongylus tenuis TaxID=148309 RepID=A0AAD5QQE3_PARTN|nr:hypothetical protein KIN20_015954 [Parelaphostrongylus tenuis]